jgi:VIT1/CCC1 family predicted Fe2+/Mn2+ transporter
MPIQITSEQHRSHRIGWLRASVLGANDGILSTASLIVGVAAANVSQHHTFITGIAGLVAGAMSMAAGEYVSVSSQADTEKADLEKEKVELATNAKFESEELAQIYVDRGLAPTLAKEVSRQLMAHDALGSHARDELGITEVLVARPIQAALASAVTFAVGGALPLLVVIFTTAKYLIPSVFITSLVSLMLLGIFAAKMGGANILKGAFRVCFWGALAMAITAGIGSII